MDEGEQTTPVYAANASTPLLDLPIDAHIIADALLDGRPVRCPLGTWSLVRRCCFIARPDETRGRRRSGRPHGLSGEWIAPRFRPSRALRDAARTGRPATKWGSWSRAVFADLWRAGAVEFSGLGFLERFRSDLVRFRFQPSLLTKIEAQRSQLLQSMGPLQYFQNEPRVMINTGHVSY